MREAAATAGFNAESRLKSRPSRAAERLSLRVARTGCVRIAGLATAALALPWVLAATAAPPRPLAMKTCEVKGHGRPLWRHWIDLDGDGKLDLVVVTGASSTEASSDEGRIEDLIAYLHVTPSFLDTRQVLLYRQNADGLEPWGEPLPLTGDSAAVDVADLDGDGRPEILYAAGYSLYAFARGAGDAAYPARARSIGTSEMLLGFTRAFVPGARLTAAIKIGMPPSVVLATPSGLEIRNMSADGLLASAPVFTLGNAFRSVGQKGKGTALWDPRPRIADMDSDGTADLLFQKGERVVIYKGRGDGTFLTPPASVELGDGSRTAPGRRNRRSSAWNLEDIDGDGLLDCVRTAAKESSEGDEQQGEGAEGGEGGEGAESGGTREAGSSSRTAARPKAGKVEKNQPLVRHEIRLARRGPSFPPAPDRIVEIKRNEKNEQAQIEYLRIDPDARADILVTRIALSMWQIPRVLISKKVSLQVSFETMLQRPDGSFAPPRGKPFETKVTIDLKRGISGLLSELRGDFNGDGIADLFELTSASEIKIHTTAPDGAIPEDAAWSAHLPREPEDRELMDVLDIDADGRSDLAYFNLDGAGFVATILRSGP